MRDKGWGGEKKIHINCEAKAIVEESIVPTVMPRTDLALVLCSMLVLLTHMPRSFSFLFYRGFVYAQNNWTWSNYCSCSPNGTFLNQTIRSSKRMEFWWFGV